MSSRFIHPVTHGRFPPFSWLNNIPLYVFIPHLWAFQVVQYQRVRLPLQEPQETQVRSLDWEDPLEEEMSTHFSILAWKIPLTEEPAWQATVYGFTKSWTWLSDWRHTSLCVDRELGCFQMLALVNKSAMNEWVQISFGDSLDTFPAVGLLDHLVVLCLMFCRTSILFCIMAVPIYIPTNSAWAFLFLHTLINTCYFLSSW